MWEFIGTPKQKLPSLIGDTAYASITTDGAYLNVGISCTLSRISYCILDVLIPRCASAGTTSLRKNKLMLVIKIYTSRRFDLKWRVNYDLRHSLTADVSARALLGAKETSGYWEL